ncbi:MAG: hypothetical protein HYV36_01235, partial [Lentisphaerae bacterium]|nr:hypothetical protein [Lentisphaerota bacterium]
MKLRFLLTVLAACLLANGAFSVTVTNIAAVGYHSLLVKSDDTVWSFGRNNSGQLGIGSLQNSSLQQSVLGVSNAAAVAGGATHSLILEQDGRVWSCGDNSYGQLGDGSTNALVSLAAVVPGLPAITAIAGGWQHSLALSGDSTIWSWGDNGSGALGIGVYDTNGVCWPQSTNAPQQVTSISNVS